MNSSDDFDGPLIALVAFMVLALFSLMTLTFYFESKQKNQILASCLVKADTVEKITACKGIFKK